MNKRFAIPILVGALLALAPTGNQNREISLDTVRGYLNRMQAQYKPHPKSERTFVVTRVSNEHAERLDLYVELRKDNSLVLTAYAKVRGRYFNASRVTDREKLFLRLLRTNQRAFATFFVDEQGDIGARFTFTTEEGVGYEPFRVAANELMRIVDQYTPIVSSHMAKD